MKSLLLLVLSSVCLLSQEVDREKLVRLDAAESGKDPVILAAEIDYLIATTKAYADYVGRVRGEKLDNALDTYIGAIFYGYIAPLPHLRHHIESMPEYAVIAKARRALLLRRDKEERDAGLALADNAEELAQLKLEFKTRWDRFLELDRDGLEYAPFVRDMWEFGISPYPKKYDNLSDIPKDILVNCKKAGMSDRAILEQMGIVSVPTKEGAEPFHLDIDDFKRIRLKRIK